MTTEKIQSALAEFETTAECRTLELKLDVARIIVMGLKRHGWEPGDLARRIGRTEGAVVRLMRGDGPAPCLSYVGEILHALGTKARIAEGRLDEPVGK